MTIGLIILSYQVQSVRVNQKFLCRNSIKALLFASKLIVHKLFYFIFLTNIFLKEKKANQVSREQLQSAAKHEGSLRSSMFSTVKHKTKLAFILKITN